MKVIQTSQTRAKASQMEQFGKRACHRPRVSPTTAPVSGIRRVVYPVAATAFFVLAIVGVILPGLPTTPFLLLTSFFLVRSYPRLNQRLLKSKLFGPILVDWQEKGGVRRDIKAKAISAVLIAISLSLYVTRFALIPALVVAFAAGVGVIVIVRLPEPRD